MRTILPIFLVGLLLVSGANLFAAEDVIILTNRQRITGVVVPEVQADDQLVSVNTGSGIVRFNHKVIDRIDLSYESRRAQVKDTDPAGLFALAKWCSDKGGMKNEALELLEKVMALPDADPAARVLYMSLLDEIRGPELALPLYKAYRDAGGDDAATLERLAQLEKAKSDYEAQYGSVTRFAGIDFSREGLEARNWMPGPSQWFNPATIEPVTIDTSDGPNRAMRVTCNPGAYDKGSIQLSRGGEANDQRLTMTLTNEGKQPLRVSISIKTGANYTFHESEMFTIPGTTTATPINVDLKSKTWKSEASKWQSNGPIAEVEQIREVAILIYNGSKPAKVLIDAVSFQGVKDL